MERLSAKSKYDMIQHLITPFQRHFLTLGVYMINLIALQINRVNSQCEKVSLKWSYEMLNHIIFASSRQSFHLLIADSGLPDISSLGTAYILVHPILIGVHLNYN